MTGSHKQEEEGDGEASSEKRETRFASNDGEDWIKDLAERLKIGSAKNKGHEGSSEDANEKPSTMSQEQIDLIREFCRERVPLAVIEQMMGVSEGAVDRLELKRAVMEAEIMIAESLSTHSEYASARSGLESREEELGPIHFEAEQVKYEEYDPVRWETAVEEVNVDNLNEEEATAPNSFDNPEERISESPKHAPIVPAPEPEYVRALKDSEVGSEPYHKKGDILRVINKARQRGLDGKQRRKT